MLFHIVLNSLIVWVVTVQPFVRHLSCNALSEPSQNVSSRLPQKLHLLRRFILTFNDIVHSRTGAPFVCFILHQKHLAVQFTRYCDIVLGWQVLSFVRFGDNRLRKNKRREKMRPQHLNNIQKSRKVLLWLCKLQRCGKN